MSSSYRPRCPKTPPRGPVLVLAPHPDDEIIGCGGTLALHALQGDPVHVVVAFDGTAACPNQPRDQVRATRRREALAGGRALSTSLVALTHQFLDFSEGHIPSEVDLAMGAALLGRILDARRPVTVYAPWPDDGHRDHRTLSAALALALDGRELCRVWGYEVWSPLEPAVLMDVTSVLDRKRAALAAHASQGGPDALTHRALGLAAWRSSHVGGNCRFAEAFRPLPRSSCSVELPDPQAQLPFPEQAA